MTYDYSKGSKFIAYDTAMGHVRKTRQVTMLYDGIIRFIQQAKEARNKKNFQDNYNYLERAGKIIIGLQASLDHENGGDVSKTLDVYYTNIFLRLMQLIQASGDEAYEKFIAEMKTLRDAWAQVDTEHSSAKNTDEDQKISEQDIEKVVDEMVSAGISVSA